MLLDPTHFSFLPAIEAGVATFRREALALDRRYYTPWPDALAYTGNAWLGVPLFAEDPPHGVEVLFERNQAACPETMALLRAIPAVVAAGISRMEPGCHIIPHTDVKPDDVLRSHLGLAIPAGASFRVGEDLHEWREGECLIFDGLLEHETLNAGTTPRIVLLVDARLNEEETAYLASTQISS